jgi:hypothetical protein
MGSDESLLAVLERLLFEPGAIEPHALLGSVIGELEFPPLSDDATPRLDDYGEDRLASSIRKPH